MLGFGFEFVFGFGFTLALEWEIFPVFQLLQRFTHFDEGLSLGLRGWGWR
jgi:hypothetical protein